MEIAGLALSAFGAVSAFVTLFEAILKLRGAYKLGASFGNDYQEVERLISVRWIRLEEIRNRRVQFLRGQIPYGDSEDDMVQAAKSLLQLILDRFSQCNELKASYSQKAAAARAEISSLFVEPGEQRTGKKERLFSALKLSSIRSRNKSTSSAEISSRSTSVTETSSRSTSVTETSSSSGTDAPPIIPLPSYLAQVIKEIETEDLDDASHPDSDKHHDERTMDRHWATIFDEDIIPSSALEKSNAGKVQQKRIRQAMSIWDLVRWSAEDRALLYGYLRDIKEYLDELDGVVRIVSPQDPIAAIDPSCETESERHEMVSNDVRQVIFDLHAALQRSNGRSRRPTDSLAFAIQVLEDPAAQATEFALQYDSLLLHPSVSYLSILKCFPKTAQETSAVIVYVESARLAADSRGSLAPEIEGTTLPTRLSEALVRTRSDADGVSSMGSLRQLDPDGQHFQTHTICWNQKGPWTTKNTLSNILRDADTQWQRLQRVEILQLARVATLAFLYFSRVIDATGAYPRPENWLYFTLQDEDAGNSGNASEASLLNPYFEIGLGQRSAGRVFGTSPGLSKLEAHPVVELGLLLYQIGSGRLVDYRGRGANGVGRAATDAAGRMAGVDRRVGPSFSELVTLCLDQSSDFTGRMSASDHRFLEKLRVRLLKIEGAALQV